MPPRSTAGEQLERILHILPAAARDGGALLDDLAAALDVPPERVLADLEEATARSFHHPGGAVEPFTILIDGRTVDIHAPHDFNRPVRLTDREALALGLGLRSLAAEAEPDRRQALLDLAVRLEAALVTPPSLPVDTGDGVEYEVPDMHHVELGDDGFRGAVADAVNRAVTCELLYLKPGQPAPEARRVAPYRLVYAEGVWYVAGLDLARDGLRFFRLDRVLDANATDEAAPPPPTDLDDWLGAAPYRSDDEVDVDVRYQETVARWILEQGSDNTAEPCDDGAIRIRHRVADPRWIVRHVLQYGGAARVEAPASARQWVAEAAQRLGSPSA